MAEAVIEPVRRSFAVLEALSRRRTSTLSVLADETALPRPTVVRLLHTLIALGYAARVSREQGYRLTDRVLGLAESIRFVDHLVDAALPHMSRFTDRAWLAALSRDLERRRHHHPPFDRAGKPDVVRGRGAQHAPPVLISALGRAWLAFCPDDERRAILRDIGGLTPRQEAALRTRARARPSRRLRLHRSRRGPRASTAWPCRSAAASACSAACRCASRARP